MTILVAAAIGLLIVRRRREERGESAPTRLVLMVLLIEIRSGRSVLAALQAAAARLPGDPDLSRVARLASVSGLAASLPAASEPLKPVLSQLARAQRSGASLTGTVHRLIEDDLAEERSLRLARARSLPTRLMIPVTLFMLPGLVLLVYAPSLVALFDDLVGGIP